MYAGLNYKSDELPVNMLYRLHYCFSCLLPLARIAEIDHLCFLYRVWSLTIFKLLRLFRIEALPPPLSKSTPDAQVRNLSAVLIALLTLCSLFALYLFRVNDDNRLMSWQWVFVNNDVFITALIILPALLLSWWLTELKLSYKNSLVFLLFASYIICTLQWSQPELIVDASRYFLQAKSFAVNGPVYFLQQWGYEIAAWTDLPLIPFIYGLVLSLVGEYRVAIQALTTLLFCGTMLLTYLIGRELWDELTGIYAAALLLAMPYLLTQVPLMLVDVPTMFFLTLAIYCMLMAVKTRALSWFVMATITILLALLSKYSTWLMLSVLVIVAPCCRSASRANLYKQMFIILSAVVLFFIVVLAWKYDAIVRQFDLLITYQMPGLARWHESHLSTFFYQVHPFITLAALSSVYFAWRQRDLRYLIVSWMLLLVLLLEIKRIRYVLVVLPMLSLMAAYALRQISDRRIRHYTVLCIIASSLAVSFSAYSPFAHKTSAMNIKQAGELLNNLQSATVEVILLPQTHSTINPFVSIPLLDLFTTKQLVYFQQPHLIAQSQQKNAAISALRFSWDYGLENYYKTSNEISDKAIVIISETEMQPLPEKISARLQGFYLKQRFRQDEGVYRYSTIVDVYEANSQRQYADDIQG